MLITPDDIIQYSVIEAVKNRPQELLRQDILEAEAEAEQITGHRFTDENMIRCRKRQGSLCCSWHSTLH